MSAYVIIANGEFLEKSLILKICQNKIIIALDGAAQKLLALEIKPHVILGDFDSLDRKTQQHWGIKHAFAELDEQAEPYLGQGNRAQLCIASTTLAKYSSLHPAL